MVHNRQDIPVHMLSSYVYCEYQIYLEKIEGVKITPTAEMRQGAARHTVLEQEHQEKSEYNLTVEEALEKTKEEKIVLVGREIPVTGHRLRGRIDEVHFHEHQIIVVDDKPNSYPFEGNKRQVWGYCVAFEEQYKPGLPLIGCLRQRDARQIIWAEPFSSKHKTTVLTSVDRIFKILDGTLTPLRTDNKNKCLRCKLKGNCLQ